LNNYIILLVEMQFNSSC